ncbi:hybrid sensor histidine kinase/response regulator transcription factor [Alkaliflexus imshenetskii]|uniref:hybrid sensor histidine kinase/response regulator transcription factor n=1 Tax=Alkaliflexus imshenetskii TaxID=286730 RepID=UPI00047A3F24|nr:hybrid sensor histidine kinase/response regulator transcription factor [Alkaliflexus imshenetskii]
MRSRKFHTYYHIVATLSTVLFILNLRPVGAQDILRFEHFNTSRGLSQNTVSSVLSDSKGFLWIGTNNGLNRYDGNKFRVFMNEERGQQNFTHNRIVKIWEDRRGFIWFETHDGHYHYFDPVTEQFRSLAELLPGNDEGHAIFSDFLQYSQDEIWIGMKSRGLLRLKYDKNEHGYIKTHYTSRGINSLSNEQVAFVRKDTNGNLWVGTRKGLNLMEKDNINKPGSGFDHLFITHSFTSFLETATELWFGTSDAGILKFQRSHQLYTYANPENTPSLKSNHITHLHITKTGTILAALYNQGLQIFNARRNNWETITVHGSQVDQIYEDRFDLVWVTTENFGISSLQTDTRQTTYFRFFNPQEGTVPDAERHVFFEDSKNNFWIGTHEGALNLYDRNSKRFVHFRNNPGDPNSISSNIVLCITEDHSGQLWVGTGQFQGGLERIILKEPAFDHLLPAGEFNHISDNIVRALFQDAQKRMWIATKAGRLHVMQNGKTEHIFNRFTTQNEILSGVNIYSILLDDDGHLWLGSKGKGILVSRQPLAQYNQIRDITFYNYQPVANDSTSLSHANVYSIAKDKSGKIWIGTYGNGFNLAQKNLDGRYKFRRFTMENSDLSSNLVRYILPDSQGRLWIATGYGLNLMEHFPDRTQTPRIRSFFADQTSHSISLNDIIHLYEDSSKRIWAASFGGGVNMLTNLTDTDAYFTKYTQINGLSNNVVYAMLEDGTGHIWFSTENGLSRLNTTNNTFEVYNSNNGLNFNSFSENTCIKTDDGKLAFGGFLGIEMVNPDKISRSRWQNRVELTDFQLFNKQVPIGSDSPLRKSIAYTNELTLRHFQSSFSIEFSAMDYLDPDKTQYAYKLDNFDQDWNMVTSERRAVYTNLSPGRYVFRVKATNREGEWIDSDRIVRIQILPPWYKTQWAFMAYSVLLVLLFIIVFSTVSKINQYRNELKVERRVNEMKLRFFTNISHEIRTPLTLIIGPIEDLLRKERLDNADKPKLDIIRRNGKRMLQLTNQLLDFRKIQNNRMRVKVSEFDIVEFARNIFESFAPLANHKNIDYRFESANNSLFVWGDPSKLDMIIYNLISNALKFTEAHKKVTISIKESDDTIDFTVSDEGRGIARENLPHIFDRYTILSGEELAGTGIGLSLSNELAKLHHGEIRVDSESGKGSTFTLRLNKGKAHFLDDEKVVWTDKKESSDTVIAASDDKTSDIQELISEQHFDEKELPGKPMVMVVEDNHEIRDYICQSLSPDFSTCQAANGEEALAFLNTRNPDIIISDVMMPVMDGMELTRQLKDNFATSHIPIVLLTSKSSVDDQIAGVELGADAYITKPFNSDYLKAVTKNLVDQRRNVIAKFRDNKTIDPATLKVNSKDEEFLEKLVAYVEENYSEDFTIEQLADVLCVSRTVFYNKVKGLTGLSPVEFVRQLKLKIAAHLLTQGYNVSEAAIKVGFSDARYFSRQFKALFGYLPSKHVNK